MKTLKILIITIFLSQFCSAFSVYKDIDCFKRYYYVYWRGDGIVCTGSGRWDCCQNFKITTDKNEELKLLEITNFVEEKIKNNELNGRILFNDYIPVSWLVDEKNKERYKLDIDLDISQIVNLKAGEFNFPSEKESDY